MILTNLNTTLSALAYYDTNQSQMWAILGQTSAWDDESSPPAPVASDTSINEEFCAQQASLYLAEEVEDSGTYTFLDSLGNPHYYNVVSSTTFLDNEDNLLIATTSLAGSDLISLASAFRTVGFATGVTGVTGHTSDTFLPAANVASWGNLATIENRIAIAVLNTSTYNCYALMQF